MAKDQEFLEEMAILKNKELLKVTREALEFLSMLNKLTDSQRETVLSSLEGLCEAKEGVANG